MKNNGITSEVLFTSQVYTAKKPEFVTTTLEVFDEYISSNSNHNIDSVYPMIQTQDMLLDARLYSFIEYISEAAWDILDSQGYNMDILYTQANSVWGQCHYKTSSMEQHSHSSLISGFFFLSVPNNSAKVEFHDPRPVKVFASLFEKDSINLTQATNIVRFTPEVGTIYFTNSWLPHSVTRNASAEPIKFIHFNIHAVPKQGSGFENPDEPIVV
jgi:uncharacterized protein (TIGR02466 family)